jgi:monoamine oxidase
MVLILGGGIAGLYTAYQLLKENPDRSITLIEKYNRLGGRIHTYTDPYMTVEAGAGRFSRSHTLLMRLIREFKLTHKIRKTSSDVKYAEGSPYSLKWVVGKIVAASKIDVFHDLSSMTFLNYAKKIVSAEEIEFLQNAFGYYTELVTMNAKDAIALMLQLNDDFYVMDGGLSQIIEELTRRISMYPNAEVHTGEEVVSISRLKNTFHVRTRRGDATYGYTSESCVCTLPPPVLATFTISHPIKAKLAKIVCGPLCRIYCTFKEPWFGHLKYTTSTPLRMIIPITPKTIMISYTDNVYALFWRDLHEGKGIAGVNRALKQFMKEALGVDMPAPLRTKVFFWECGVGYWAVNSDHVHLVEPFPKFYLCGEGYSKTHQQWIEGSLETAAECVQRIQGGV